MLHACITNTIVLPEGALVVENEVEKPTVSVLKGVGINMAMIPWGTLYVMQDGVIAELWAKEGRTL